MSAPTYYAYREWRPRRQDGYWVKAPGAESQLLGFFATLAAALAAATSHAGRQVELELR